MIKLSNVSDAQIDLPPPFRGTLDIGQSVTMEGNRATVLQAMGGSQSLQGLLLEDVSGSEPAEEFSISTFEIGAQTDIYLDAVNGNDSDPGTQELPIKTINEFNLRIANIGLVETITLHIVGLGGATDAALALNGVHFQGPAKLVIIGESNTVANGNISAVTALQSGVTYQLDTTGVTWSSSDVGKRLQLDTSHTCWVQEVIDADTIIVGPVCNLNDVFVPLVGQTFAVQTLPPFTAGNFNILTETLQPVVDVMGFDIQPGAIQVSGGASIRYFGCRFSYPTTNSIRSSGSAQLRGCLWQLGAPLTLQGGGSVILSSHTSIGSNVSSQIRLLQCSGTSWSNTKLLVLRGSFCINLSAMHFRNTPGCVTIFQSSRMVSLNVPLSGSVGNTLFGINVGAGCGFTWIGATKPSVTGNGGLDAIVGTTTRTWANIPFAEYPVNGAPAYLAQETA